MVDLLEAHEKAMVASRSPHGNGKPPCPPIPFGCREPEGNTPQLTDWGCNSEYGVLTDVLLGPADNFHWLPTSSISGRLSRAGTGSMHSWP